MEVDGGLRGAAIKGCRSVEFAGVCVGMARVWKAAVKAVGAFAVALVVLCSVVAWVTGTTVGIPVVEKCVSYERNRHAGAVEGFPWVDVSRVDWLGRLTWHVPECDALEGTFVLPDGSRAVLEDQPSESEIEQMNVADSAHRLVIPKVGVDTQLKVMSTYSRGGERMINPPTFEDAYLVRDWGDANEAEESMVVVALHSTRRLPDVAGSRLIDIEAGKARVGAGDEIGVDGHVYRVKAVHVQSKKSVPSAAELWRQEPGKLLIFTCLQRSSGRSLDNVIVEAYLEPSAA